MRFAWCVRECVCTQKQPGLTGYQPNHLYHRTFFVGETEIEEKRQRETESSGSRQKEKYPVDTLLQSAPCRWVYYDAKTLENEQQTGTMLLVWMQAVLSTADKTESN
jgi:hypothetical protein